MQLSTYVRQTQAYAARVQEAHALLQEQADRTRAEAAEARDTLEQQLQVGTGAGVGVGSKAQQAGRPSAAAAPGPPRRPSRSSFESNPAVHGPGPVTLQPCLLSLSCLSSPVEAPNHCK